MNFAQARPGFRKAVAASGFRQDRLARLPVQRTTLNSVQHEADVRPQAIQIIREIQREILFELVRFDVF